MHTQQQSYDDHDHHITSGFYPDGTERAFGHEQGNVTVVVTEDEEDEAEEMMRTCWVRAKSRVIDSLIPNYKFRSAN